jgi:hypothetical protein
MVFIKTGLKSHRMEYITLVRIYPIATNFSIKYDTVYVSSPCGGHSLFPSARIMPKVQYTSGRNNSLDPYVTYPSSNLVTLARSLALPLEKGCFSVSHFPCPLHGRDHPKRYLRFDHRVLSNRPQFPLSRSSGLGNPP